jgi:hypothetical protein
MITTARVKDLFELPESDRICRRALSCGRVGEGPGEDLRGNAF